MNEVLTILAMVSISGVFWLSILMGYDKVEPEPMRVVLKVGILGGAISVLFAGFLNGTFQVVSGISSTAANESATRLLILALFVGINEETCKALATIWLGHRRSDIDEPIDCMIYALSVSLGFAVLENIQYIVDYGSGVLFARHLLSVPAHLGFGALWGYGYALTRFDQASAPSTIVKWIAIAAFLHATFNFVLFTESRIAAVSILIVIGLLAVTHRKLRRLLKESPHLPPGECFECRFINPFHARYCSSCGIVLEQEYFKTCLSCGTRIRIEAKFCGECGGEFS